MFHLHKKYPKCVCEDSIKSKLRPNGHYHKKLMLEQISKNEMNTSIKERAKVFLS